MKLTRNTLKRLIKEELYLATALLHPVSPRIEPLPVLNEAAKEATVYVIVDENNKCLRMDEIVGPYIIRGDFPEASRREHLEEKYYTHSRVQAIKNLQDYRKKNPEETFTLVGLSGIPKEYIVVTKQLTKSK